VLFDALSFEFREVRLKKNANCPVCGTTPSIHAPIDYEAFCAGPAVPAVKEPQIPLMTVEEFHACRGDDGAPLLLDVRNPHELEIACVADAIFIPLGDLPARLHELDPARSYVVTCHKGARAERACLLLKSSGFERLQLLQGGIDAWAERIDTTMARYG
jgi:adenylyltransferase/sulfurtransferase